MSQGRGYDGSHNDQAKRIERRWQSHDSPYTNKGTLQIVQVATQRVNIRVPCQKLRAGDFVALGLDDAGACIISLHIV